MPSVQSREGVWHGGERYEVRDLKYSLIESTPGLWEWWSAMAPEGWGMSEASEEDESIISRADAIHKAEVSDVEHRKQAAERRDRCLEKLKQLGSATSKLHQSQDRLTSNPLPDPSPFLDGVFSAMTEVCRAFRLDGFEKVWQRVDREATFNHYRSGLGPPEKARVAFDWGCRLLDRGFQGQLRQEDVVTTWNKPALRYGFNIVQILLFGVLGEQRIEFQEESLSSTDCSRVQLDAVEDVPAYKAEEQSWLTPLPLTKDVRSEELLSLAEKVDVVLITATDTELEAVFRKLEPYPRRQAVLKGFAEQETYYLGKFGACVAAVTKCRMGSLDSGGATLATEHAQRVWRPRAFVMVGIALGRDPEKQKIADILVASQVISYEPQRVGEKQTVNRGPIPPANPTLLNRFDIVPHWSFCRPDGSKCKREVGPILSGEKMVDAAAFKASLLDRYPQAIGGEMEGVGLAAAAVRHGVPWILAKGICDWADGRKHDRHQALAAAAAVSLVHHVLSQTDVLHGLHKPNQSC
jgi:nucleoside phosphorylase